LASLCTFDPNTATSGLADRSAWAFAFAASAALAASMRWRASLTCARLLVL